MSETRPDFLGEMQRGPDGYDRVLGDWWLERADDADHRAAYEEIARRAAEALDNPDPTVLDLACGAGHLLLPLARHLPHARLIAVDGSPRMLDLARAALQREAPEVLARCELLRRALPDFSLPVGCADLVVFCFPNICSAPGLSSEESPLEERAAAHWLAQIQELDKEGEPDPETLQRQAGIFLELRRFARNAHRLLVPGGLMVHVDYAGCPAEEFPELERLAVDFEMGCLNLAIDPIRVEPFFELLSRHYYESPVVEDVFHQTGDPDDREGGYMVSLLRAI